MSLSTFLTPDNLVYGIRVASLALSGVWYGAGQYITTVEVPARANLPTAVSKVENFQQIFPRAMNMQKKIAGLCILGGISQYFLDKTHPGTCYFLTSGLTLIGLFPWTKFYIMPTNLELMDEGALKKDDAWMNGKIDHWGKVHFVRTVLGGIAFALNIKAFLM